MRISDWSSDVCSSDEAACQGALDALRKAAAAPQSIETNLLAHAVEAARASAALGEISLAMEDILERYGTQTNPAKGVHAAPNEGDDHWTQELDAGQAVTRPMGRKPHCLCAQ